MSTVTFSQLPATQLRLPQSGAVRRVLTLLSVAAALVLGALAVNASPVASQFSSSVHIQTATAALHRAADIGATAHSGSRTGSAVLDRAGCWRQAHRLGLDPSACASTAVR